jgi:hypothetical protein
MGSHQVAVSDRTYAATITGATDSVGIPPAPLDKGGGDSRGDLATH